MRKLVVLLAAFALLGGNLSSAIAQDATPGAMGPSLLSQMGLPVMNITLDASGMQAPTEIAAGETLVVVENKLDAESGVFFVQLPEGVSIEEAIQVLGPPPEEEGAPAEGSPAASPAAGGEEEMGPPPPLFYDVTWGSGVFSVPGFPAEAALTFTPGEWYAVPDGEGMMPVAFQVTGEMPSASMVTADQQVEVKNFQFILPEQINAGPQVWSITSTGDQPHEMFITKTPRRLTLDEVEVLLTLPEDQLPPEGFPNPAEFQDIGGVAPVSKDLTVSIELNLEPGAYVAVCFMPDKDTGEPHAMKGMVVVFEVPEEGQTVQPAESPVPEEHDMGTPTS